MDQNRLDSIARAFAERSSRRGVVKTTAEARLARTLSATCVLAPNGHPELCAATCHEGSEIATGGGYDVEQHDPIVELRGSQVVFGGDGIPIGWSPVPV